LAAYEHPGQWACMDTLRDVEYLNTLWDEGRAFWKLWSDETTAAPTDLVPMPHSSSPNWPGLY
jgi:hypothetical protein